MSNNKKGHEGRVTSMSENEFARTQIRLPLAILWPIGCTSSKNVARKNKSRTDIETAKQ